MWLVVPPAGEEDDLCPDERQVWERGELAYHAIQDVSYTPEGRKVKIKRR